MNHNHRQEDRRVPRMLPTEIVSTGSDAEARNVVFTLGAPRAVVIKINSKDALGLPIAVASKEQTKEKLQHHREVAAKFGIDGDAYRDRHGLVHNGFHLHEGVGRIRLDALVADLASAGYKLTHASRFQKPAQPGKRQPDPTVQLVFSLDGEAIEMTDPVKTFLAEVYVDGMHLWCNPKMTKDEAQTPYRLDTINGFAGQRPKNAADAPGVRLRYAAPESGSSGYVLEE